MQRKKRRVRVGLLNYFFFLFIKCRTMNHTIIQNMITSPNAISTVTPPTIVIIITHATNIANVINSVINRIILYSSFSIFSLKEMLIVRTNPAMHGGLTWIILVVKSFRCNISRYDSLDNFFFV